jgi:serine/threonine protein kinase
MVGRTVAHYRILERIGAGGMGIVYRSQDTQLGRPVALKVVRDDAHLDDKACARLLREARTASALNHPNICTIYEAGMAEGETYIAMELVEGKSLSAVIGADGLPVETAIRYAVQIADALAHAHERGVVHRDLKGANVIVTPEGRAKVLDFGLAKRAIQGPEEPTRTLEPITEAGSVAGTLCYMAPEVLHGEPADARSDLWALGVMLYEAVTGTLPFRGTTAFEITSAILRDSMAPLPAHVPPGLAAIIQRLLAKQPGERYQRAGEVRAALEGRYSLPCRLPVPCRWLRLPAGAGCGPQVRCRSRQPLRGWVFSSGTNQQHRPKDRASATVTVHLPTPRRTITTSGPSSLRGAVPGSILHSGGGCWSGLWRWTPDSPPPEVSTRSRLCCRLLSASRVIRACSIRRKRKPGKPCGTTRLAP